MANPKKYVKTRLFVIVLLSFQCIIKGQNVTEETTDQKPRIEATLMDYIEGTDQGDMERLKRAFHPDFNLYAVTAEDSLLIRDGQQYIEGFTPGKKSNRPGKIIFIDYENNAATAKVEVTFSNGRVYIDYFLLLLYEGSWKIVQKSYTRVK